MAKPMNQVAIRAAKKAHGKKATAPAKEPAGRKTRTKNDIVVKRPKNYKGYKVVKKKDGDMLPQQMCQLLDVSMRQSIGMCQYYDIKQFCIRETDVG